MKRILSTNDDIIKTAGGRVYQDLVKIGEGGTSHVYQAIDCTDEEARHVVLLKKYRNDCKNTDIEQLIEQEARINEYVKEKDFSGAIVIDYFLQTEDEHGTIGVMDHAEKGITLSDFINSGKLLKYNLKEKILLGKKVFELIHSLHEKCNLVHGDVKPDNIFVLEWGSNLSKGEIPTLKLLDFGNAQIIDDSDAEKYIVSYTKGYTQEDFVDGYRRTLTVQDDLYSAVMCFWNILCEDLWSERNDEKISVILAASEVNYVENYMVTSINERNFVQTKQKNAESIKRELLDIIYAYDKSYEYIIERINRVLSLFDDNGISKQKLYENLKSEYKDMRNHRFPNLSIIENILPNVDFRMKRSRARFRSSLDSQPEPLREIMKQSYDSLFMIGDGGMGKTTSLLQIMDEEYENDHFFDYHPIIFIELCVLSQNYNDWYTLDKGGTFIEQFAASYLTDKPRNFLDKNHPYVDALKDEFFKKKPNDHMPEYTVLLDGMNEIGFINTESREIFFKVLNNYLNRAHNIRIVITGRSDAFELSGDHIRRLHTIGLEDVNIEATLKDAVRHGNLDRQECKRIIEKKNQVASNEYRLWQCLKIPFFLQIYCMVSKKTDITRQGELLNNFFHDKRETLDLEISYGEKKENERRYKDKYYGDGLSINLAIRVLLDFIIPELAIWMAGDSQFFIRGTQTKATIFEILKSESRIRRLLKSNTWEKGYYGYQVNVEVILEKIMSFDKGEQITNIVCDVLGIMRKTSDGALFFVHQYFRDYFAACAVINRMKRTLEFMYKSQEIMITEKRILISYLDILRTNKISVYICTFVGEILGEHYNLPVYDAKDGKWKLPEVRDDNQEVLIKFLDFFRIKKYEKASYPIINPGAFGIENMISIFKGSRIQNDGRVDFTGLSLEGIDLTGISLYGIIFSRFGRKTEDVLTTNFTNSYNALQAIMKDDEHQLQMCLAIHPTERKILLQNKVTGDISEVDLEQKNMNILVAECTEAAEAFYIPNSDYILLVTYKKESEEIGRKSNNTNFTMISEHNPDNVIKKRNKKDEGIWFKFCNRKSGASFTTMGFKGELLSAGYNNEQGKAVIFLKREHSLWLVLAYLNRCPGCLITSEGEECPSCERKMLQVYQYELDDFSFSHLSKDTFFWKRTSDYKYLIGDRKVWNNSVGEWNLFSGSAEVSTLYYCQKKENKIAAACYNEKGILYILFKNGKLIRVHNKSDYMIDTINTINSEVIPYYKSCLDLLLPENKLLVLFNRKLSLYNLNNERREWICNLEVENYFVGSGGLIVNAADGVYDVDLVSGSTKYIQKYTSQKINTILGQSTKKYSVILHDTNGIVKWIDIRTGCCYRHLLVEKMYMPIDRIFDDDKNGRIIGTSETNILFWDNVSGKWLKTCPIHLPEHTRFLHIEFSADGKKIYLYLEEQNYQSFPLKKKYIVIPWNLKFNGSYEIIIGNSEIKEKMPIHRVYTADLKTYVEERAFEYLREVDDDKEITVNDNHEKRKKRRTIWPIFPEFHDYKYMDVYVKNGRSERSVCQISAEDCVIGATSKEIICSCEDDTNQEILKIIKKETRTAVEINTLSECEVKQAFVADGIIVIHALDNWYQREVLFFLSRTEKEVYEYKITDTLLFTGCKLEGDDNKEETDEILNSQGCTIKSKKDVVENIVMRDLKATYVLRDFKERMHYRNTPAFVLAVLLSIIGVFAIFGGISDYIVQKDTIISYLLLTVILAMVALMIKTVYPHIVPPFSSSRRYWIVILMFGAYVVWNLLHFLLNGHSLFYMRVTEKILICLFPLFADLMFNESEKKNGVFAYSCLYIMMTISVYIGEIQLVSFVEWIILYTLILCYSLLKQRDMSFSKLISVAMINFAGILAVIYYRVDIEVFQRRYEAIKYSQYVSNDWGELIPKIRNVLSNASIYGKANIKINLEKDYTESYFFNFLIGRYGILFATFILLVLITFLLFLFRYALNQVVYLDKIVCLGCTLFFVIQTILSLLPSLGLQFMTPDQLPFMGVDFERQLESWMFLGIYFAYYKAHKYDWRVEKI